MTGKAKTDFEIYFRKKYPLNSFRLGTWILGIADFYNLPAAMQWGVLVDFFDSVGIIVKCEVGYNIKTDSRDGWDYNIELKDNSGYVGWEETIQLARTATIEKAIEIYNQEEL